MDKCYTRSEFDCGWDLSHWMVNDPLLDQQMSAKRIQIVTLFLLQ